MSDNIKVIDLKFVNSYLIKLEDGFILIDTGTSNHWEMLESELIKTGCLPDKLKLVIITHGDPDHTGNCFKLKEKYNVKVAMHEEDEYVIQSEGRVKRIGRGFFGKLLMVIGRVIIKVQKNKNHFEKFKPDIFLTDEQSMKEYGFDAKVIHIPGHTKGSIGILTNDGALFSGDTLANWRSPGAAPFVENFDELKSSLERLKKLDTKMVYPGHGKTFTFENIKKISV